MDKADFLLSRGGQPSPGESVWSRAPPTPQLKNVQERPRAMAWPLGKCCSQQVSLGLHHSQPLRAATSDLLPLYQVQCSLKGKGGNAPPHRTAAKVTHPPPGTLTQEGDQLSTWKLLSFSGPAPVAVLPRTASPWTRVMFTLPRPAHLPHSPLCAQGLGPHWATPPHLSLHSEDGH